MAGSDNNSIRIEPSSAARCPGLDAFKLIKGGATCATFYMEPGEVLSVETTEEGDVRLLSGGRSIGRISVAEARALGVGA